MRGVVAIACFALLSPGCSNASSSADDGRPDAGATADAGSEPPGYKADFGPAGGIGSECVSGSRCLSCEADATGEVLIAASAGDPTLQHLGDADPATPAEVGDGKHHLFVGVKHGEDPVFIHDATLVDSAYGPIGTYQLAPDPLVSKLQPGASQNSTNCTAASGTPNCRLSRAPRAAYSAPEHGPAARSRAASLARR
jgi:hypothetical protein